MPRLTLIFIAFGAVLVVATTLIARLFFPPVLRPDLQAAPDDTPMIRTVQRLPALQDVRQAVQLRLDPGWSVATVTGADLEQVLRTLHPNWTSPQQPAVTVLLAGLDNDATIVSATHRSGATLQVVALKRNGMNLETYLDEVGQQLSTASATVHSSEIDATLRTDRLPAAMLHYSLTDGTANGNLAAVMGMQVATFDAPAARLVIFTLTGQPGQQNELAQLMGDILAAATF